jgi:signal transduction histidine kinase
VILAAGFGVVIGWSLVAQLRPIYGLLLSTILITLFYALLSWRAFAERERYIEHLRPFVTSQRLYDQLLTGTSARRDAVTPFEALCHDILETSLAYLAPLGPLAPLAGPTMAFPNGKQAVLPPLADLAAKFPSPVTSCRPLDPADYAGAIWAVPLWSERGLVGMFLLGAKRDGGLYTQEEIEIAQASGERLIDAQASTEMARRLMTLQRQRLARTQVMDRQTRRVLHDEILPELHASMLVLTSDHQATGAKSSDTLSQACALLSGVHDEISLLLREAPSDTPFESAKLELISALKRFVTTELPNAFDEVHWQIEPEAAATSDRLSPLTTEVIFYAAREAIRNSAQHGRGQNPARPLQIQIKILPQDGLTIQIEDDGVGFDFGGESARENGQGLALHSTMMAVVGGYLSIESGQDSYTRVTLALPQEIWSPQ